MVSDYIDVFSCRHLSYQLCSCEVFWLPEIKGFIKSQLLDHLGDEIIHYNCADALILAPVQGHKIREY